jgi:hypothetical protein
MCDSKSSSYRNKQYGDIVKDISWKLFLQILACNVATSELPCVRYVYLLMLVGMGSSEQQRCLWKRVLWAALLKTSRWKGGFSLVFSRTPHTRVQVAWCVIALV